MRYSKLILLLPLLIALSVVASRFLSDRHTLDFLPYKEGKDYPESWARVDSFVQKGLPKDALLVVDSIRIGAVKEDNYAQLIKTLLFHTTLKYQNEENSQIKIITETEEEIAKAPFPARPVMQSLLADMYWSYYQANRYKILNRTATTDFKQDDIATWDAAKFATKVSNLYLASLQPADSVQRTKLEVFDQVLATAAGSKKYRPTLYDFLSWKAIDFFSNTESGVTQAATSFSMNDPRYLGSSENFMHIALPTNDTISFKLKALKLLQQCTSFQMQYGNPTSLVDVEVKRLQFARSNMDIPEKDSLFKVALQQLETTHTNDSISTMVGLEIARLLNAEANKYYEEGGEKYKWRNKEAIEKCRDAAKRFPETTWAQGCIELIAAIKARSLDIKTEGVNIPNAPFLAQVNYANTDTVYFRVVDLPKYNSVTLEDDSMFLSRLLNSSPVQSWKQPVPGAEDYRTHKTEAKIPALKKGTYYIIASNSPRFDNDRGTVAYCRVSISNIGFIWRSHPKSIEYMVQDRTTGQPLKGAKAVAYTVRYDDNKPLPKRVLMGNYTTNDEGIFTINTNSDYPSIELDITYKGDRLEMDEQSFYQYGQTEVNKKWENRTFFFLDRAIYRPGQTVYFKGLAIETNGDENRIKKHFKQNIDLTDINGQKVSTLSLTSNEYGTFNGTFVLPTTGLTGNMSISSEQAAEYSATYFKVEEYKRPHFEVKFEPIKGSFKLGEKVSVKGKAMNYSGTPVDGATVSYNINRETFFPFWGWLCWWKRQPSVPAMHIANNTVKTSTDGSFTIEFTAVADTKVDEKDLPEYSYNITADVTDQGGETQSTNTNVKVGAIALHADMTLQDSYLTSDTGKVNISTENLNGEFEPAQGTIQIHRLVDPGLMLRERKWDEPDQYTMTESEFRKNFPNDIYKKEDHYQSWTKGNKVLDITFNTEKEKTFILANLRNWKQGKYIAEMLTHDHFGKEVKVVKYFTVMDMGKKELPVVAISLFEAIKTKADVGEKASIMIGTSAKDVRVLYEVVLKNEVIHREWIKLSNEKKVIELPIEERFRGDVLMRFMYTTHARNFNLTQIINVPFSNKDLTLKFATFRDKLSPGSEEEWKVKITGPKGEKLAAEMLASMYDASLDAFATSDWSLGLYNSNGYYNELQNWVAQSYDIANGKISTYEYTHLQHLFSRQQYDDINNFNLGIFGYGYNRYNYRRSDDDNYDGDFNPYRGNEKRKVTRGGSFKDVSYFSLSGSANATLNVATAGTYMVNVTDAAGCTAAPPDNKPAAPPRTNFAETAFFYPQLQTDSSGNIVFKFKVPDALTRWKFRALAHTQDLKYGMLSKEAVTQKDLMVTTNAPRFLREGDDIELTAKINSLVDKELSGNATLTLIDPYTDKPINSAFGSEISGKVFKLPKNESTTVSWKLHIPEGVGIVTYRISAEAGNFSDAEESALPILANRMLVTESMPINIKGGQEKTFTMDRLVASGNSKTLTQHKLTLELTSNPAWYAVQALPYLMEYPYECSEQVFNRYYSNSLATHVANSNPRIKQVFDSWKTTESKALTSNLEKNQDLKSLMIEETPWVREAKNESERKKRLSLLFDLNKMSTEQTAALNKLQDNQAANGGWPWFKGMPDNRYITQYVITGLGRLQHLGVLDYHKNDKVKSMMNKGLNHLDALIAEDYQILVKRKADLSKQQVSDIQVQYLYARTFYKDWGLPANSKTAYDYYFSQAKQYWLNESKYSQAMIALILAANGDNTAANGILKSLQQTATRSEEMGMYWKDNTAGYYWYQAPIETQAMMIEAFSEVGKDQTIVDDLRTWLLKQKQVQDWKTTKATSDACYALLLNGTDWLTTTEVPSIIVGSDKVEPGKNAPKAEAGTGYFRTSWDGKDVKPSMGKVTIKKQDKGVARGSLYWQYLEQLDKITTAKTPLQLDKKLFVQTNTAYGAVLTPITEKTVLKPGDLVKVRIELRSDRDMDFVQMKDMRASGFEPVDVLSGYRYQGGLGYYQSPRDAATNFFFDRLFKGTYVFEYALRVSQKGNFSNGVTTIQCMYAPEFTSHSEGVRVTVK